MLMAILLLGCVSIRALAWRAMRVPSDFYATLRFQSAPSRGGRSKRVKLVLGTEGFNPRPRVEGDV